MALRVTLSQKLPHFQVQFKLLQSALRSAEILLRTVVLKIRPVWSPSFEGTFSTVSQSVYIQCILLNTAAGLLKEE